MSVSKDSECISNALSDTRTGGFEASLRRPAFRLSDLWRAPLHDLPTRDEILYQYLPLSPKMRVLEVGPGSGFTAFRMTRHVRHLTLVDVSPANVARLRRALGATPNLRIVCADVCAPGLGDIVGREFDAIYGLEVFEYLAAPGPCLANFAAMLRPGGILLLEFPNYPPPRSPGITFFRTRQELESLLRAAGFSSWTIDALRLCPLARFLYDVFHERPLRLYRRWRQRNGTQKPMIYEQTWTFQNKTPLEPLKPVLHLTWAGLMTSMRAGGQCFERTPLQDEILNRDLFVLATR